MFNDAQVILVGYNKKTHNNMKNPYPDYVFLTFFSFLFFCNSISDY
ncbi:MAG: hypothetical protein JWQ14_3705 [Adhaeribacter sp.]|nr:hypothetical protein [Adhaeribacter sp.]